MRFFKTFQQDAETLKTGMRNISGQALCKNLTLMVCLAAMTGCAERPFITETPQMEAEEQLVIRVLLLDNIKSCSLTINRPFTVSDSQTQTQLVRFERLSSPSSVTIVAGGFVIGGKTIAADRITITPDNPFAFTLNGDDFRGELTLVSNFPRTSFDAINALPVEPYLSGVIGAEMPDYWEPAALRAQAIAARTYCLYIKKRFGVTRNWDVNRTVASQVYRGIKAESVQVWQAVNGTAGQVLVNGVNEEIFPAYYSSACGGHTEDSINVFGDAFRPLSGVACPYCVDIAKTDRFFWTKTQVDKNEASEKLLKKYPKLQSLGKIISILPSDQSNYGNFSRVTTVRLIGSTGNSDSIRAEDLRLTLDPTGRNIKSMICKIENAGVNWAFTDGRGYGHGVGLCQCGTQGMARLGSTTAEILSYYYPGSKIKRIY